MKGFKYLALVVCACLPVAAGAQDSEDGNYSEYRDNVLLQFVYNEANEPPYSTGWSIHVEQPNSTKRLVYIEAQGKLPWTGVIAFDCDESVSGEMVKITQSSEPGLPGIYDRSLTLGETAISKWKISNVVEDMVGADGAEGFYRILPYEAYVIARYEACERMEASKG
ncbi:MAG: hypothetical protein WAT93_03320 [Pontixanthobacter sp.]